MNGLLVVDKPGGMTSHDVVSRVRVMTGERSIGHLGTLDPMATGVLPLLLGRYTRLAQFFSKAAKQYTGSIQFGWATDTFDAMGEPAGPTTQPELSLVRVQLCAEGFLGLSLQMPPIYSAKKIAGKRAYKFARKGIEVDLKPVPVDVSRFEILDLIDGVGQFAMTISSGGYVRSVAHDLGQRLGCGAHLLSLRRVAAGDFALQDAMSLEQIASLCEDQRLEQSLPHPRRLLCHFPAVTADQHISGLLRNGVAVNLPEFSNASRIRVFSGPSTLLAIARRIAGTLFQPEVVLG